MLRKIALQFGFMMAAMTFAYSQSGTLVKSFGDNGIRHIRFDRIQYSDDFGGIIKRDTSGKILIAGTSANGTKRDICVARLNTDGSLDTTFGQRGKLLIPAGKDYIDQTLTFDVDGHGNILLAGLYDSSGYCCIMRLDGNGRLDPDFGSGGKVTLPVFYELNLQIHMYFDSRKKIILGFYPLASGSVILRLNPGGTIDSSFGTNGKVFLPYGYPFALQSFTVDKKDRILLSGLYKYESGNKSIIVMRLTSEGNEDNTFGELPEVPGRVPVYPYNDYDNPLAKAIVADSLDRILIGINTGHDSPWSVLIRLNENGLPDTSFGGGKVILDNLRQLNGIAVDGKSNLFVAGPAVKGNYPNSPVYNSIYCLKNDGTPDRFFGVSGVYSDGTLSQYSQSQALQVFYQKSLLPDHDGNILWAGTAINDNNLDFRVSRLSAIGKEDNSFNRTGTVWLNGNDSLSYPIAEESAATSLIMDHSGRLIMAGYSRSSGAGPFAKYDYFIARLDTGGHPDLTFNNSGSILIPALSDFPASPHMIACDENNKILISGYRSNKYFLQQFNENGDPDAAFGSNGSVLYADMYPNEKVLIDIDRSGRIWLFMEGGYLYDRIFRLTPGGLPDTLNNGSGEVGTRNMAISKIYRSDNGDLYVLGRFPLQEIPSNIPPKILKINDKGIIDTIMDVKITKNGRYYINVSGDNTAGEEIRLKSIGSSMTSWINACMNDSIFITVSSNTWPVQWMSTLRRGIIWETPDTTFTRDVKTETLYGRHYNAMVADCDYFWLAGQDSSQTCLMISKHYARDNQTISFSLPDTMYIGDPPRKLQGLASSGLPVNYSGSNTGVALISNDTLKIVGEGTVNITASQPGSGIFYAADPVIRNLKVNSIVTDVHYPEPEKEIKTYPNPVSDILCLKSPAKIRSVTITCLEGNVIYKNRQVNDTSLAIDFSEVNAGCYLITIQLYDNSPGFVRKIIKL